MRNLGSEKLSSSHSKRELGLEPPSCLPVLPLLFPLYHSASHVQMVIFVLPQNKISETLGTLLSPLSGEPNLVGKQGSASCMCARASALHGRWSGCSGLEVSLTHCCLRTLGIQIRSPRSGLTWQGLLHCWVPECYTGPLRQGYSVLSAGCCLFPSLWLPESSSAAMKS